MDFENKLSSQGIYYSQYAASWVNKGGNFNRQIIRGKDGHIENIIWCGKFREWLKFLGLKSKEAKEIARFAENGTLELECSAEHYLRIHGKDAYEIGKEYRRWVIAMQWVLAKLGIEADIIDGHLVAKDQAKEIGLDLLAMFEQSHSGA